MSSRRRLVLMDHFPRAIALLTDGMVKGKATHKSDHAWKEMTPAQIESHMVGHFSGWMESKDDDPSTWDEDHLRNMVCRAMMLLEMREKQ